MADEAELNFFRLLKVFLNPVNKALRICFLQEWESATGKEWTNDTRSGQFFINLERSRNKKSKLFSPDYAETFNSISNGDVSKWDATALFFALLYSKSIELADPSKGYRESILHRINNPPYTLGEHIDHLRKLRNDLFHTDRTRIDDRVFAKVINDVVTCVSEILGKDHELVANIIQFKKEDILKTREILSLRNRLEQEKQKSGFFHENLVKLEDEVERLDLVRIRKRIRETDRPFGDLKTEEKNTPKDDTNFHASRTSIITKQERMRTISQKLRRNQDYVIEIMYPNRPDVKKNYKFLINTSNQLTYEFEWEKFNSFIEETLLDESLDDDIVLFAKIQLAKGLSHRGKKEEALKLLNNLVSCVSRANSVVPLVRIFYRLAYIYHDLKDEKKANEYISEAEQVLANCESYEDRAEIQYAKANISLARHSDDNHLAIIDCLNNTIEATEKSLVDMTVLGRQALLRNSLAHLGYLQHTIKTDIKSSHIRAASDLLHKYSQNCQGVMSKRNQFFQLICESLLSFHQHNHSKAIKLGEKAFHIAEKHELSGEMKQIEMLQAYLKSSGNL